MLFYYIHNFFGSFLRHIIKAIWGIFPEHYECRHKVYSFINMLIAKSIRKHNQRIFKNEIKESLGLLFEISRKRVIMMLLYRFLHYNQQLKVHPHLFYQMRINKNYFCSYYLKSRGCDFLYFLFHRFHR